MDHLTNALRLHLALVFALAAFFAAIAATQVPPASGATVPRVTLSVPSRVTQGATATARGKVLPPLRGRVLLQVRKDRVWRVLAAGKVRRGRFRISFAFQGSSPSALRLRATLARGRHSIASSPVRTVQLRPIPVAAEPAPGAPSAPSLAPRPAAASPPPLPDESPGGEEPSGGEELGGGDEEPSEPPPPPPPPGNAYWGAWIGSQLTGGAAPWDMSAVSEFERMVGKPLSLIEFSSPFADCSKSPCTYFSFPWDPFNAIRAYGAIPFFSWGSQSIPGSATQPDFQLADILAGTYDSYIRTWATRAAEWGHPFFLRFDWEMNGGWFPWGEGTNGNQAGEFIAAWRHVHDIFTSVGATNATWVWCPYANRINHYASLYPGDSYVDWTCLDSYNWGTNPAAPYGWVTFDSAFGPAYAKLTETVAPAKPVAIAETASSEYGGSKAGWIEEMFEALPTSYPKIRGLIWFENVSNGMDWPIETSESAVNAFSLGIGDNRYLGNVFGGISASPIPAP
ncbi:MAG TPA: glycosyl hydrolase [Solirubrobacterales bacterium]|nr:glycosyl hydrolase [Solirubrobacterales bacterium]